MKLFPAADLHSSWLVLLHLVDVRQDAFGDSMQAFHQHIKKHRLETVYAEIPAAFLLPLVI